MYKNIVLAYDGSLDGREALKQGAEMAIACGAHVQLVAVIANAADIALAESVYPSGELLQHELEEVSQVLQDGEYALRDQGLSVTGIVRRGQPVEEIVAQARRCQADLIVVGHREQSTLARWWRGSVGQSLLSESPCSVLVCVIPKTE